MSGFLMYSYLFLAFPVQQIGIHQKNTDINVL